jgi:ring-1,2-phenylacetyl-CoA epoxidase subunit PaaD
VSVALLARAKQVCADVPDPELPVLTIGDLGIVRAVTMSDDGDVDVVLTPTYSGCPATEAIRDDVRAALRAHGFSVVSVRTELSPAWTTDWITEAGRRKLAEQGIAPPSPVSQAVDLEIGVRCPRCGAIETRLVSRFGSTPCKAMYRCGSCLEPFDAVKPY